MEADEQQGPLAEDPSSASSPANASPDNKAPNTEVSNADSSGGLKGTRSLRRLRDRIERVAHELHVLREENASLNERIQELESMPPDAGEGGIRFLETDPDTLKRKVEGFIEVIDQYLDEKESS